MGIVILILILGVAIAAFAGGYAEQLKRNVSSDLRELEKFREEKRIEAAAKKSAEIIKSELEKQNADARFHAAVASAVQDELAKRQQQARQYGHAPAQPAYNPQPNPQPQRASWKAQKAQSQVQPNPVFAQPIQYPPQSEQSRQFDEVPAGRSDDGNAEQPMPVEYTREQEFPDQHSL